MSFKVEVWGKYAMFTRPEFKVERYSYDVMTPSAARRILQLIYWNPGIEYVIDSIHVLNPIQHMNICTNEVENLKIKKRNVETALAAGTRMKSVDPSKNRIQRQNQVLCDVRYVIEAHAQNTELAYSRNASYAAENRILRRVAKGQFYSQPYLGCRNYTAYIGPCNEIPACPESLRGVRELGFMLWGKDFSDPKDVRPQFFNAILCDGVLSVPAPGSDEVIQ